MLANYKLKSVRGKTGQKVNKMQCYLSMVFQVSDLVGHLDTATVTVGILDVNEPPKCFPPYNFVVDATATSGQTVAQLTCYDSDRKTEFRTFSYHLSPDASSTVRGLYAA